MVRSSQECWGRKRNQYLRLASLRQDRRCVQGPEGKLHPKGYKSDMTIATVKSVLTKSWTDQAFGYRPVAWYRKSPSRRYLPSSGFVYKKAGHAGMITSTVLTFPSLDISDRMQGKCQWIELLEWSVSPPFKNIKISLVFHVPAASLLIVISVAPRAWRIDIATIPAYSPLMRLASVLTWTSKASALVTAAL